RSAFQRQPLPVHPPVGRPVEGIYLGEVLAVSAPANGEAILPLIKIPEMKIDQQLVRLQVHHIVGSVLPLVQTLRIAVKRKGDCLQDRRLPRTHRSEYAKELTFNQAVKLNLLCSLIGIQTFNL